MLGLANIIKFKPLTLVYILLSSVLYLWFAYDLERTEAIKLVLLYVALFIFAFQIIKSSGFYFRVLVGAAILFRFLFLLAIPNLSQDFYRFIWDGTIILEGFNPYLYVPNTVITWDPSIPLATELHSGMGELSAQHFTNYPPINQICFVIGNLFPGRGILSSVIGMRLLIIAADIGTLYFGKKLLEALKLPSSRIFWYILNPFVIIEFTGNLHFEGVMLFFLIWSLYLLHLGKWKWAALVFACSVSVKLIPLMFLPLFFWWFVKKDKFIAGLKQLTLFYMIVGLSIVLLFLPFFSMAFITNYAETVGLWFGNFEFNASIYYILREIGFSITGYNEIQTIGKILPVITLLSILGLAFLRKNYDFKTLASSMLLAFTVYLFLSTTVHPWYISTLVLLCMLTNYRFPLVWSLVIILSYLAYLGIGTSEKSENLWIISLEYLLVYAAFFWEVVLKKKITV